MKRLFSLVQSKRAVLGIREQSSEVRSVFYAMSKGVVHVPRAQ